MVEAPAAAPAAPKPRPPRPRDAPESAQALLVEGRLALVRGALVDAEALLARALTLARAAGDHEAAAACHRQFAEAYTTKGDLRGALASLERAMAALEAAGDGAAVADVMVEIARVVELLGLGDRARRTLEDAILQAQRVDAPEAAATAAGELGRMLAQMGDLEAAATQLDRAAAAWEAADDPDGVIGALHAKADLEAQRREADAQRELLARAWAVEGASLRLRADAGLRFGWALLAAAAHAEALQVLDAVPPLLDRVGDRSTARFLRAQIEEVRAWPTDGVGLAFALRRCGDERGAEALLLRMRAKALASGDMVAAVTARAALYLIYTTRADLAAAVVEMDAARKEARGISGLTGQLRRLEGNVRAAIFGVSVGMID
ncbi:MAG: hypothetical protein JNM72_01680 [Deltaproteobacteria bacterium]|nr:hypothetical protein [Deltaproteobacteria bacterium]